MVFEREKYDFPKYPAVIVAFASVHPIRDKYLRERYGSAAGAEARQNYKHSLIIILILVVIVIVVGRKE